MKHEFEKYPLLNKKVSDVFLKHWKLLWETYHVIEHIIGNYIRLTLVQMHFFIKILSLSTNETLLILHQKLFNKLKISQHETMI